MGRAASAAYNRNLGDQVAQNFLLHSLQLTVIRGRHGGRLRFIALISELDQAFVHEARQNLQLCELLGSLGLQISRDALLRLVFILYGL